MENQQALLHSRAMSEIESLVHSIEDAQLALSTNPVVIDNNSVMMSTLLYSYQDGYITLDTFLNAIQIDVNGFKDYYDQLNIYYRNIFHLEMITGTEIVSLSHGR